MRELFYHRMRPFDHPKEICSCCGEHIAENETYYRTIYEDQDNRDLLHVHRAHLECEQIQSFWTCDENMEPIDRSLFEESVRYDFEKVFPDRDFDEHTLHENVKSLYDYFKTNGYPEQDD